MLTLTDNFDDYFIYDGKRFNVCMYFDNILSLYEMFDDDYLKPIDKMLLALEILVYEYDNMVEGKDLEELYELYKFVMKEFLDIDVEAKDEQGDDEGSQKVMDFRKDAGLIYASFLHIYGIDLFEQKGKLHWKKFMALLTNLSNDAIFKEAVSYRKMKVPTEKEATKEYRNHVIKMKEYYSLDREEGDTYENLEKKFDTLARIFKGGV